MIKLPMRSGGENLNYKHTFRTVVMALMDADYKFVYINVGCYIRVSDRFNKIATQGAPQMAVDKEANSLSRVYSYYSKFNLRLFYV